VRHQISVGYSLTVNQYVQETTKLIIASTCEDRRNLIVLAVFEGHKAGAQMMRQSRLFTTIR
jgi:hypothetical protein